jgi:Integrase core domain
MFNQIIAGKTLPRHLSSDHDPLFRFHRWLANLRILEVEEIKSTPYVPASHPFVERLIGTVRREFLDHVLIWNAIDLERKLGQFRVYYNENRVHQSLSGCTPGERSGEPLPARAVLDRYAWRHHCRGLFQMPIAAQLRIRHGQVRPLQDHDAQARRVHSPVPHALAPLCFASPSPPSGWTGDFHPPAIEHAGHTTKLLRGRRFQ